jgi:hypothetical protein
MPRDGAIIFGDPDTASLKEESNVHRRAKSEGRSFNRFSKTKACLDVQRSRHEWLSRTYSLSLPIGWLQPSAKPDSSNLMSVKGP